MMQRISEAMETTPQSVGLVNIFTVSNFGVVAFRTPSKFDFCRHYLNHRELVVLVTRPFFPQHEF